MRLFIVLAVAMLAGGVFLIVDGAVKLKACSDLGLLDHAVWSAEFWLAAPGDVRAGLGPNGQWFVRLAGGLGAAIVGWIVLRIARK